MANQLERTVLRSLGQRDLRSVIGAAEELLLPRVSLAAGERSSGTTRQAGLELVPVAAISEQAFGHGYSFRAKSVWMEMDHDPGVSAHALHCLLELSVSTSGIAENARRALACLHLASRGHLFDVAQRSALRFREPRRLACLDHPDAAPPRTRLRSGLRTKRGDPLIGHRPPFSRES
jgi:hypothetical protein